MVETDFLIPLELCFISHLRVDDLKKLDKLPLDCCRNLLQSVIEKLPFFGCVDSECLSPCVTSQQVGAFQVLYDLIDPFIAPQRCNQYQAGVISECKV